MKTSAARFWLDLDIISKQLMESTQFMLMLNALTNSYLSLQSACLLQFYLRVFLVSLFLNIIKFETKVMCSSKVYHDAYDAHMAVTAEISSRFCDLNFLFALR